MQSNSLYVVFPDGIGIRNYLYSKVFDEIGDDLVLLHDFDPRTIDYLKSVKGISRDIALPKFREGFREKFLRELISLVRLKNNAVLTQNDSLLFNWNPSRKTPLTKIFYKAVETVAAVVKGQKALALLERQYAGAVRRNVLYKEMKSMFALSRPGQLFCTHQRGLRMPAIFAAAQDLGICTTTVIYSWDNLPKARLALRADRYLVWSEHMKAEMKLFYPEIPENNVIVTGTPQFEFYADEQRIIDKALFYARYDLDPAKKIICYSGDDVTTSPDDPAYLRDIAQAIVSNGMDNQWQILFRRCPVDSTDRFDAVLAEYANLIKIATPLWHTGSAGWERVFPQLEDVDLLVSTVFYSEVVVNVGSTMAFDFSMFGKPAIFINYDQQHRKNPNWSVTTIYQFQHFRSMQDRNAVFWLNAESEIIHTLQTALQCAASPAMLQWRHKILGINGGAVAIRSALGIQ